MNWQQYEIEKQSLPKDLTNKEYEQAVKEIVEKLESEETNERNRENKDIS